MKINVGVCPSSWEPNYYGMRNAFRQLASYMDAEQHTLTVKDDYFNLMYTIDIAVIKGNSNSLVLHTLSIVQEGRVI